MLHIYGIKNCDTMKKAFKWLGDNNVAYEFHDYKKGGFDKDVTLKAIKQHGWDKVLNKRGTPWRQLPDDVKDNMDDKSALLTAFQNPSIIKRPLIVNGNNVILGFDADQYAKEISA